MEDDRFQFCEAPPIARMPDHPGQQRRADAPVLQVRPDDQRDFRGNGGDRWRDLRRR